MYTCNLSLGKLRQEDHHELELHKWEMRWTPTPTSPHNKIHLYFHFKKYKWPSPAQPDNVLNNFLTILIYKSSIAPVILWVGFSAVAGKVWQVAFDLSREWEASPYNLVGPVEYWVWGRKGYRVSDVGSEERRGPQIAHLPVLHFLLLVAEADPHVVHRGLSCSRQKMGTWQLLDWDVAIFMGFRTSSIGVVHGRSLPP